MIFTPGVGLAWHDVPSPRLEGPSDVLVRPVAVAVCDADRAIVAGKIARSRPHRFGHEFVADVVELGELVDHVAVGDRVVVPFKISCGTCTPCRRGITAACSTVPLRSAYGFGAEMSGDWGGAMSDLIRVPFADHMLVPLPAGVAASRAASAGDNLADAYRCVAPGLVDHPHSSVLVMAGGGGAPSISLYSAAIAVALGADRVDYVDRDEDRLGVAERLGARSIEMRDPHEAPDRLGDYPVTVDASAHPSGRWLDATIKATEPYGVCTSCGAYDGDLRLPLGTMYTRGIHFTIGWVNARPLVPIVLDLLADGAIDVDQIHTVMDWDSAPQTISAGYTKLVLVRPGIDAV